MEPLQQMIRENREAAPVISPDTDLRALIDEAHAPKRIKTKGERLGWKPIDEEKSVSIDIIVVRGKRVKRDDKPEDETSYLIP
jgi:hypothetical protein